MCHITNYRCVRVYDTEVQYSMGEGGNEPELTEFPRSQSSLIMSLCLDL